MFVFSLMHSQPELHLWCESVTTVFGGCYCCLSICLPTGYDCLLTATKNRLPFLSARSREGKSEVMNARLFGKTTCNNNNFCRPGAVIGPRLGASAHKTLTRHERLWTAECLRIVASWKRKKKRQQSFFCWKKPRTLFKPLVNRDGGLLRDWGGQLRSTLNNRECVVRGSLHPSCPLFSLVGAHRTCWPVLLDRGGVNPPNFSLALH